MDSICSVSSKIGLSLRGSIPAVGGRLWPCQLDWNKNVLIELEQNIKPSILIHGARAVGT